MIWTQIITELQKAVGKGGDNMEYIFLGMIISLVAIAIWSAKETQHFIDSKNAQARLDRAFKIAKEREDKNNG